MSGEYSELTTREATNFGADEIGDLELGRRRCSPLRMDVEVGSDRTRLVPLGADDRGRAHVLLVRAALESR